MPKLVLPSFNKGEISPELYGRVDVAAYAGGLASARNMIVHTYGGISKRPGMKYIAPVKDHSYAPRLKRFEFKSDDSYILEFGDEYMRVIRNDGHVLDISEQETIATISNTLPALVTTNSSHGYSNGDEVYIEGALGMTEINQRRFVIANVTSTTFTLTSQFDGSPIDSRQWGTYTSGATVTPIFEITTPYAIEDVMELNFTQSADTMDIVHPGYVPRQLTRTYHDEWTLTEITFAPQTVTPTNFTFTDNSGTGSDTYIYHVTAIDAATLEESLAATDSDATVDSTDVDSDLAWDAVTGADRYRIYLSINGAYPAFLTETGGVTFTDDGSIDLDTTRTPPTARNPFVFITPTITPIGDMEDGGGLATAFDSNFDQSSTECAAKLNVDTAHIGSDWGSGNTRIITGFRIYPSNNVAFLEGGFIGEPLTITLQGSSDNFSSSIVNLGILNTTEPSITEAPNNYRELLTDINTSIAYRYHRLKIEFSQVVTTIAVAEVEFFPALDGGNFPSAVGYYQQRKVFGGTDNNPDVNEFSKVGAFNNFTRSISLQDDDAITARISALEVNEIRHYIPLKDLIVLTFGSEWIINRGFGDAFTPTTITTEALSKWGASKLIPEVIGDTIIYLTSNESDIRSLSSSIQGYDGNNLNILSRHLTNGYSISDWTSIRYPDSRLYMVRNDGVGISLSFDLEQQTIAWTPLDTDGSFERVEALKGGGTYQEDSVYWVVKRTINGNTVRYIEVARQTFFSEPEEPFYVDSGISYSGSPTDTFTGLHHLEGETVVALADGNVISNISVTDGEVSLNRDYSVVHIGLPFTSQVKTLNLEGDESSQGDLKRVTKVVTRLFKSRGAFIGPDANNLNEMKIREDETYGSPTALLTGDNETYIGASWNTNGQIFIQNEVPTPMTILAIIPYFQTEFSKDE